MRSRAMPNAELEGAMAQTVYVCAPGFEATLVAEIARAEARVGVKIDRADVTAVAASAEGAGWVEATDVGVDFDPAFARQRLPRATRVCAPTISTLARAVCDRLIAASEASAQSVARALESAPLHLQVAGVRTGPALGSRARLVERAIRERLGEVRRTLARRIRPWTGDAPPPVVVQVLLTSPESAWMSVARPRPLAHGGFDVTHLPGGVASLAVSKAPPSRAYLKLLEAWTWMGRAPGPGDRCVDLGGAPGGWSYVALQTGAEVTGVDRAQAAPIVARHPRYAGRVGDAYRYVHPGPADWLLCDIIGAPERTAALVNDWIARDACRHVVATLKLKDGVDPRVIDAAIADVAGAGWGWVRAKHLVSNQHEVTLMASADLPRTEGSPPSSP